MATFTLLLRRSFCLGHRACGLLLALLAGLSLLPGRLHAQLPVWTEASTVFTSNQYLFHPSLSAVDANGDVVVAGGFQSSITFGTLPALTARGAEDVYVAKQDGRTHQWLWAVRGGGSPNASSASSRISLAKLVLDKDGNILLAGFYSGSASFGSLPVLSAATSSNGGGRALVVKLAGSDGSWLWATGSDGTSSFSIAATSLAVDGAGNAIVAGYFGQTALFGSLPAVTAAGSNDTDAYVAGLSGATGQWQWVKPIASPTGASTLNVAVDATSNVVVTGYYTGPLTLGTLPALPSGGNRTLFIAKLTPTTGQWLWATRAVGSSGSGSTNYTTALTCTATGDVLVAGEVQNGSFQFGSLPAVTAPAAYLARLDGSTGAWQWVKPVANVLTYDALTLDATGALVAGGTFVGTAQFEPSISLTSSGNTGIFISKTNVSSGQVQWATRAGKAGPTPVWDAAQARSEAEVVQSIGLAGADNIVVTGNFQQYVDFGLLPTLASATAVGGRATYLAHLSLSQFALTAITPARHARAAPVAGPVTAVYSKPLAAVPTIRVFGDQRRGYKAGVASQQSVGGIANNAASFLPSQPFSANELVSVTVASATAAAGGSAVPAWVYQFRAAAGGSGRGLFSGTDEIAGTWQSALVTKGDLDNDGDLDLLSAGPQGTGGGFTLGLNDGTGHFAAAAGFTGRGTITALTLADADADGDLDVAWAAHYPGADSVLLRFNDGTGSFSGLSKVAVDANPRGLAFGDLDADGDLDLVASSYQTVGSVSVRFNNGAGVFSGTGTVATGATTYGVALGDLDNDGDLDVVAANEGAGTVATAFNNGTGSFTSVVSAAVSILPRAIFLADINRDGHLDFVAAPGQAGATALAIGIMNNETQRFTANSFTVGPVDEFSLADIDADGDADLLTLNQTGRIVRTWLNNGVGTFFGAPSNSLTAAPAAFVLGDLDGDGDVDWVTANGGGTLSPRFNTGLALATQSASVLPAVAVYPNPAHQRCTVGLPAGTTAVQLTLTNALGQSVLNQPGVSPQPDNSVTLDLTGIPPGLYHLSILTATTKVSKALVVE